VEVIQFPNQDKKGDTPSSDRLYLGAFTYTCACGNKSTLSPQNLIFRSIEFYCPKCGTCHRISNPAFTPSPPPPKSKR
jgi:hypothetical protein